MSNLLNKLRESKLEAAKRIGAVVLAGAIALGGTTACTDINNTTKPTIGGITNPSTPGSSSTDKNNKHSALLMSVVNDEYYKSLMARTKIEDYAIPAFDAHPFAFLEDEGIDVDKILDGTYKATTMSFVYDDEPNNLYINTRVLIDDNYYQAYLITYKLTDKEMADYRLIHGDNSKYSYTWPAFFINDKISATKQPTEVLSTKYTKKTHEVFEDHLKAVVNKRLEYIIPLIDYTNNTYLYLRYPKHHSYEVAVSTKSFDIGKFKYSLMNNINGIYEIPQSIAQAQLLEKDAKNATTFNLQNATIFRGKNFESISEQS